MHSSSFFRTTTLAAIFVTSLAVDGFSAVSAPVLKWSLGGCTSWCQTGWYASPAVADLDGDGQIEVIWGSYDVVSLNGANKTLEWRGVNGSRVWPGVVVADLTGDGSLEVVVGRGGDQVTVYNSAGTALWTRNPFGSGEIRTLAVADLDGDGPLEIIVGQAAGVNDRQISVYSASGNVRSGWPARRVGEPGWGSGMYNENIAVADMNGDGFKEIFGPTDTHYITALDRSGNQLTVNAIYSPRTYWSQVGVFLDNAVDLRGWCENYIEYRPNFADSAPIIADVDGNGTLELILIGNMNNCAPSYTDFFHVPYILNSDRTRWSGSGFNWTVLPTPPAGSAPRSEDYNVIQTCVPNPAAVDLDSDGFLEILFPSYDGRLHTYWLDKTQHGNWPYTVPSAGTSGDDFRFASEPAVADLDNDGHAEVIFTSWPKIATNLTGHLHILDYLGNELHRIPLPTPSSTTWNGGLAAPTLADIDGDGDLEAVVGTSATGLVAYDLPGTSHARILWGTGRGSQLRTGEAPKYFGGYHSLTPCRVLDTRNLNGPLGGPVLAANSLRTFTITGSCGVPANAKAISANLTVVNATASGELQVVGGHLTSTTTSSVSVPVSRARANNAVVQLSTTGDGTISAINSCSGTVHFILDINGYFR